MSKASSKKVLYTDEQLRYMIAPPVVGAVAPHLVHPDASRKLISRLFGLQSAPPTSRDVALEPRTSVPVLGSIGGSALSRSHMKAYREKSDLTA